MKALTLHSPWAWAICYLGKDVENRTWQPPAAMVGQRIAIHAGSSSQWKPAVWLDVVDTALLLNCDMVLKAMEFMSEDANERTERDRFCSSIVATAVIESVLPPKSANDGWHMANQYGWKLTDVQVLFQPVPVARGMLGLWTVPAEIERAVMESGQ